VFPIRSLGETNI